MSAKNIPVNKVNYLRMLNEINRPDMDFPGLEDIIKRDAYLTYTLLNYINSAYFGLRSPVGSIMQALSLLGRKRIKKMGLSCPYDFHGGRQAFGSEHDISDKGKVL